MIPLMIGTCSASIGAPNTSAMVGQVDSTGTETLSVISEGACFIDWGDGATETSTTASKTYTASGTYQFSVRRLDTSSGTAIIIVGGNALTKVFEIQEGLREFRFSSSPNLIEVPLAIPSSIELLRETFLDCTSFNQDIGGWDVGNVVQMNYMFSGATSFNQDIGGWDVGTITEMEGMFSGATSFNQDIGGWDVSSCDIMEEMFSGATSFNQDLSGWCVSLIGFQPPLFSSGATAWVLPKPVWGTCPA